MRPQHGVPSISNASLDPLSRAQNQNHPREIRRGRHNWAAEKTGTPAAIATVQTQMRVPGQGQADRGCANADGKAPDGGERGQGRRRWGWRDRRSLVLEHEPPLDGVHPCVLGRRAGHACSLSLSRVAAAEGGEREERPRGCRERGKREHRGQRRRSASEGVSRGDGGDK